MAHVINFIPKASRVNPKVQTLTCMQTCSKNIDKRIEQAAKMKEQLKNDVFEKNNGINQSAAEKVNNKLI